MLLDIIMIILRAIIQSYNIAYFEVTYESLTCFLINIEHK